MAEAVDNHDTLTLLACIMAIVDKRLHGRTIARIVGKVPLSDIVLYVLSLFWQAPRPYPARSVLHTINTVVARKSAMINLLVAANIHGITATTLDAALLHLVTYQKPGTVSFSPPHTETPMQHRH
tara:strand:+ start:145 stop:519 length:375 start_codon:yes stop_codon:yes gene_type:complete